MHLKLALLLVWVLLSIPLFTAVRVLYRLVSNWRRDAAFWTVAPALLATSSSALAIAAWWYVQVVGPLTRSSRLGIYGLLLSLVALGLAVLWTISERNTNSTLTLGACTWMFMFWVLVAGSG